MNPLQHFFTVLDWTVSAIEAGANAYSRVRRLIRPKPAPAAGLSHRDVEQQQAQIRSATAQRVAANDIVPGRR